MSRSTDRAIALVADTISAYEAEINNQNALHSAWITELNKELNQKDKEIDRLKSIIERAKSTLPLRGIPLHVGEMNDRIDKALEILDELNPADINR